mmetsp:Transcript_72409/g.169588  ORF Transcript_72409/g.169588 Transcript_72409/m.169588 type:complete len:253 (-) Transcript_72409:215-973(-)
MRLALAFHTCFGVADGIPSSSTVWMCEIDLYRHTMFDGLLAERGDELAPGSEMDFGMLPKLPVVAVDGESGARFGNTLAVMHFWIGFGLLDASSTVVTGSAAIQNLIEAICSKDRLSKPTEKTGTASYALAVARHSSLLSSQPFVTAVSKPWKQSSKLKESSVKCALAVNGVGKRSSTEDTLSPSTCNRRMTSCAFQECSRIKNAPRRRKELGTAPGLLEHAKQTHSSGLTSCNVCCRNWQKSKIVSKPSGP